MTATPGTGRPGDAATAGVAGVGRSRDRSNDARPARHRRTAVFRWRPVAVCVVAAVAGAAVAAWLTTPEPVPGIPDADAAIRAGIAVARLLVELGAALCVGTALLPLLTGRRPTGPAREAVARDGVRLGVVAAAVWLAGAVASVVLLAAELSPGRPVTVDAVATYVRTFGTGQALLLGAGAAALCLALAAVPQVPAVARAVPAALGLVPLAAAGHASTGTTAWHAVMGDLLAVHVLAAAAWVGGLVAVLVTVAPRPAVLAVVLPRFSTLAGACLVAVVVSGAANATIELATTPGADLTGPYALLAAAKAACLLAAGALAWWVRARLLPSVRNGRATTIVAWGTTELALLGLAFGLAAVLARTPPAGQGQS